MASGSLRKLSHGNGHRGPSSSTCSIVPRRERASTFSSSPSVTPTSTCVILHPHFRSGPLTKPPIDQLAAGFWGWHGAPWLPADTLPGFEWALPADAVLCPETPPAAPVKGRRVMPMEPGCSLKGPVNGWKPFRQEAGTSPGVGKSFAVGGPSASVAPPGRRLMGSGKRAEYGR